MRVHHCQRIHMCVYINVYDPYVYNIYYTCTGVVVCVGLVVGRRWRPSPSQSGWRGGSLKFNLSVGVDKTRVELNTAIQRLGLYILYCIVGYFHRTGSSRDRHGIYREKKCLCIMKTKKNTVMGIHAGRSFEHPSPH